MPLQPDASADNPTAATDKSRHHNRGNSIAGSLSMNGDPLNTLDDDEYLARWLEGTPEAPTTIRRAEADIDSLLQDLQGSQADNVEDQPAMVALPGAVEVDFTDFPFLATNSLSDVLNQDIAFLQSQGCLRVPQKAILTSFVRQYFLYVHPLLPVLNEKDFWIAFNQPAPNEGGSGRISLLVFQAMLFVSCNFVPQEVIAALGYSSIRDARAALYRRAKLLYDFGTESSSVSIAQAALLLSYWGPDSSVARKTDNTIWVTIAVHHAKLAGACSYCEAHPGQYPNKNELKRLWWCCVIRDRILSINLRRSINITRSIFNFEVHDVLSYEDLADEVENSDVYDPDTKHYLIGIALQLMDLCIALTDVLTLAYSHKYAMNANEASLIYNTKTTLLSWYREFSSRFPNPDAAVVQANSTAALTKPFHDSVILYTNLTLIYYHSARAALAQYDALRVTIQPTEASNSGNMPAQKLAVIYHDCLELQNAVWGVLENMHTLVRLQLARWMPISVVGCLALPLLLLTLDARLSSSCPPTCSSSPHDSTSTPALRQKSLTTLFEAMRLYHSQYEGVYWLANTVRRVLDIVNSTWVAASAAGGETDGTSNDDGEHHVGCNWTDIFICQPSYYLRLALTMDFTLSNERSPGDGEFPTGLKNVILNIRTPPPSVPAWECQTSGPASRNADINMIDEDVGLEQRKVKLPSKVADWVHTDRSLEFIIQMGLDVEYDMINNS